MPQRFHHFQKQLEDLSRAGRLRRLVPRKPHGNTFTQDGREFINFGSNDYLGLASQACSGASASGGGSSSLVCGWTDAHQRLAERIAKLESTEAATLFPTGFAACSGVVATLPAANDLIFSDQYNHASLIDGCRLSAASRQIYPHRDVAHVEAALRRDRARYDRVWIVTDTVFSMDGTVAPLVALCDLCDRYDAILIVDEAHATGVIGDHGSGVCEALGVKSRVSIRIGTLSKAIGSQGGFVAGPQLVIDYLINRCRSLIYSTSLAPQCVAAGIVGLDAIEDQPERRQRVQSLASRVRAAIRSNSGDAGTSAIESVVPIIPLVVGGDQAAIAAAAQLADAGLFVPAIRPPTVPENTARLRISLSASHSDPQIEHLIRHLKFVKIFNLR